MGGEWQLDRCLSKISECLRGRELFPLCSSWGASGTLRMVDFAKDADFWANDKDASDANRAKAQGLFAAEFHSALAQWKPRSQTLVIFLFADNLSEGEASELRTSIANNGDAVHKRTLTPGKSRSSR
jgi:hypothetical protein